MYKVCFVVHALNSGGVEKMILNYSEKLDRNVYQKFIIYREESNPNNIKQFEEKGFKCFCAPSKKYGLQYFRQVKRLIKQNDFDIIHSNINAKNYLPLIAAWICGVKVRISHCHGEEKRLKHWFQNFHLFLKIKLTIIFSTKRLSCGEYVGKKLYGKSSFEVLPNCIDVKTYNYNEDERNIIRKKYNIPKTATVYGNISRICEEKNHRFLIEVFTEILKKDAESRLLLVGDGELMNDVRNIVELLKITNKVIFTGQVADSYKYYNAMDLLVFPSISEGLPVSLVEAQFNKLPILVSDSVTNELAFSNNTIYIPLGLGYKTWAEEAFKLSKRDRNTSCLNDHSKEYDLNVMGNRLNELYLKELGS